MRVRATFYRAGAAMKVGKNIPEGYKTLTSAHYPYELVELSAARKLEY